MSTNSVGDASQAVGVTLLEVVSPATSPLNGTVLAKAKAEHQKEAGEALVGLARDIMMSAQARLAGEVQRVQQLEAELEKAEKALAKTTTAVKYAETNDNGLFALAATLGAKQTIVDFCRRNSIVVPPNDSEIWNTPDQKNA